LFFCVFRGAILDNPLVLEFRIDFYFYNLATEAQRSQSNRCLVDFEPANSCYEKVANNLWSFISHFQSVWRYILTNLKTAIGPPALLAVKLVSANPVSRW